MHLNIPTTWVVHKDLSCPRARIWLGPSHPTATSFKIYILELPFDIYSLMNIKSLDSVDCLRQHQPFTLTRLQCFNIPIIMENFVKKQRSTLVFLVNILTTTRDRVNKHLCTLPLSPELITQFVVKFKRTINYDDIPVSITAEGEMMPCVQGWCRVPVRWRREKRLVKIGSEEKNVGDDDDAVYDWRRIGRL